jgi:DNA-binding NarL/FixJ family response regulator
MEQRTVHEASLCQPQPVSRIELQTGHTLTEREVEMIRLMARGMVVKEIARTLQVSEKTVRNHLSNIYRKCNVYDRVQIVLYALKMGLVHLSEV